MEGYPKENRKNGRGKSNMKELAFSEPRKPESESGFADQRAGNPVTGYNQPEGSGDAEPKFQIMNFSAKPGQRVIFSSLRRSNDQINPWRFIIFASSFGRLDYFEQFLASAFFCASISIPSIFPISADEISSETRIDFSILLRLSIASSWPFGRASYSVFARTAGTFRIEAGGGDLRFRAVSGETSVRR